MGVRETPVSATEAMASSAADTSGVCAPVSSRMPSRRLYRMGWSALSVFQFPPLACVSNAPRTNVTKSGRVMLCVLQGVHQCGDGLARESCLSNAVDLNLTEEHGGERVLEHLLHLGRRIRPLEGQRVALDCVFAGAEL